MLQRYVVTYDVADPKRLRRVFKLLSQYGDHLQLSVFECQLNEKDLVELRDKLSKVIKKDEDQVLLIRLGPVDGRSETAVEALGREYKPTDYAWVIV